MKNIYFIGFMGCGKTTVASTLARSIQREWIDLDEWIVREEKMPIPHIFEQKGEVYFRALESRLLQETLTLSGKVVSTGGGIIGKEINRTCLNQETCIYLDWPFEELYRRIAGDTSRPLVKSYEQLKALYEARRPLYEASCTLQVKCEGHTPYSLTNYLVDVLKLK